MMRRQAQLNSLRFLKHLDCSIFVRQKSPRGFLPRPLLRADKMQKQNQPRFCQILSPENSFGKTESAFRPATLPEYLYGQNTKKKNALSIFRKNHPRENQRSKEHFFFLGLPSEARRWRGFRGAYDLVSSHHALRAWHIIQDSAGNESELFGIMTTIPNLKKD